MTFIFLTADSCPQPEQLTADSGNTYNNTDEIIIENCTTIKYYDYFSGSEYSYALSFLALGLVIPGNNNLLTFQFNYVWRYFLSRAIGG